MRRGWPALLKTKTAFIILKVCENCLENGVVGGYEGVEVVMRKPWEKADNVRLTCQARLWGSSKHGLQAPNGSLSLLHKQILNLNSSIRPFQFGYFFRFLRSLGHNDPQRSLQALPQCNSTPQHGKFYDNSKLSPPPIQTLNSLPKHPIYLPPGLQIILYHSGRSQGPIS